MIDQRFFKVPKWTPGATLSNQTPQPSSDDDVVSLEVRYTSPPLHQPATYTVLFLPFWGGSASTYDAVITSLHNLHPGVASLSVSYAGTGRTPVPADDSSEQHSILPRAAQILHLLRLPEIRAISSSKRLIICAHSMSVKITYAFLSMLATESEPIVELNITGLVLLGPAPIGPLILPPDMRDQQLKAYDTPQSTRWTIQNVLSGSQLDKVVLEQLVRDCVGMSKGAKAGWLVHGMSFDCTEYLEDIRKKCPGLKVGVLVGKSDRVEMVESVKEQTVLLLGEHDFDVELSVLEGYGHLLPVEAPEQVAKVIAGILSAEVETT